MATAKRRGPVTPAAEASPVEVESRIPDAVVPSASDVVAQPASGAVQPVGVGTRPYRLRPGAKFSQGRHAPRSEAGDVVYLTENQARAFADRIDPV